MDFRKEIELLKSEQDRVILNMAYSQMLRYHETKSEDDMDYFCDIVDGYSHLLISEGEQIMEKIVKFNAEV